MAIFTLRIFTFGAVSLFVLGFLPHRVLAANSETNSSYMVNAQKLITELLKGYDRRVVPVTDGPVLVSLNLNVANFELDEYGGKFKVQGMLVKFWVDSRLDWDRKKYNIKVLCLPMKDVWRPDITLYNYVDHIDVPDMNEQAHIWKGGSVSDYNRMFFTAACEIDLKRFPFDTQTCELVFGSWLFSGDFVNLTTRFDNAYVYHERSFSKWHIESAKAKVNIRFYACCKEHYPEYVVTFVLRRLTTYSSHVLVFPAILLSALVPFLFLIPPESKERITLGIALIALCIMGINEINTVIPRYHSNVPIIVIYYVLTLVWVALSVILSIFVLNIHNRGPRRKKVPAIIRQIFLRGIRHLVGLGGDTYYAVDEEGTLSMRGFDRSNERDAKTGVQGSPAVPKSERDMDEIKKSVQYLVQRATITDARQEISSEWQQVALVIDRILFIFFLLTFFISTLSIFA